MTDYVRALVTREGASDYATTTSALHAASEGWKVLDEPTHDRAGAILPDATPTGRPVKSKVSVATAASEKAAASAKNTDNTPSNEE